MKRINVMLVACLVIVLGACKGEKTGNHSIANEKMPTETISNRKAPGAPQTSSELKENFMGTFSGVLPCADCPGILTTLTLNADGTYSLETVYQGKGDEKPFTRQGKWTPSEDLAFIELDYDKKGGSGYYKLIDKNTLEKLDSNARPITSELNYKLTRM